MHTAKNHLSKGALLVFTLALLIPLALTPAAAAYEVRYGYAADALWDDGLFLGSDGSFHLDKPMDRAAGVTMIVRLLGKEAEAKAGTYETPFTDVPAWAAPYIGFAYTNGITAGMGKNTFGSTVSMSAGQFLTMTLRALGYDDNAGDFSYDKAPAKALELGLIGEPCYVEYTTTNQFLRDNAAVIAYNALSQNIKGTDTSLRSAIAIPGRPAGDKPTYTASDVPPASDTHPEPEQTPSAGSTCGICGGAGRRACQICRGSGGTWGFRVDFDPVTHRPNNVPVFNTCTSCAGGGYVRCNICNGTGTIK